MLLPYNSYKCFNWKCYFSVLICSVVVELLPHPIPMVVDPMTACLEIILEAFVVMAIDHLVHGNPLPSARNSQHVMFVTDSLLV